ncbi:MAG: DUF465 domain-containing protein [Betaproteobacteria bacterium]|nr:DUF465 domain-containing protein [Betaproteobacteria bacterium]
MEDEEIEGIKRKISELQLEHRDLDDVINKLQESPIQDELQLRRLKKRKLMVKDHIAMLERQISHDIA